MGSGRRIKVPFGASVRSRRRRRARHLVAVVGGEGGEIRGADDSGGDQDEGGHRGEHRARAVATNGCTARGRAEASAPKTRRLLSGRVGTHHRGAVRVRDEEKAGTRATRRLCCIDACAAAECGRATRTATRAARCGASTRPPRWMTKTSEKSRRAVAVGPTRVADEITVGTNRLWIDGSRWWNRCFIVRNGDERPVSEK